MKEILKKALLQKTPLPLRVMVCNKLICCDQKMNDNKNRVLECRMIRVKELVGRTVSTQSDKIETCK